MGEPARHRGRRFQASQTHLQETDVWKRRHLPPRRRAIRSNVWQTPATELVGLPPLGEPGGIPKPANRHPFPLLSLSHARPEPPRVSRRSIHSPRPHPSPAPRPPHTDHPSEMGSAPESGYRHATADAVGSRSLRASVKRPKFFVFLQVIILTGNESEKDLYQ